MASAEGFLTAASARGGLRARDRISPQQEISRRSASLFLHTSVSTSSFAFSTVHLSPSVSLSGEREREPASSAGFLPPSSSDAEDSPREERLLLPHRRRFPTGCPTSSYSPRGLAPLFQVRSGFHGSLFLLFSPPRYPRQIGASFSDVRSLSPSFVARFVPTLSPFPRALFSRLARKEDSYSSGNPASPTVRICRSSCFANIAPARSCVDESHESRFNRDARESAEDYSARSS